MGLSVFAMLGIFMNLSQGLQIPDVSDAVHETRVAGVLGGDVELSCLYSGTHTVLTSFWNRVGSSGRSSRMAGFRYDGSSFGKDGFSTPASVTNLTVKLAINSLDMEGWYTCVFSSDDDEDIKERVFLTVIVRPEISIHVDDETVNGTQYQTVSCTASHAKPPPEISWDIRGSAPNAGIFSVSSTNSTHPNGTASFHSQLRFPVVRNNEHSATCVVRHAALPQPSTESVQLQTFVSPTVSMEMRLVEQEEKALVMVECRATGGRPPPDITWVLPASTDVLLKKCGETLEEVAQCRWFPPYLLEGENITCVFGYSLLPAAQTRTLTLPSFHLTSLQLKGVEVSSGNTSSVLMLGEGDRDILIAMEIQGNVPSYEICCRRDGDPLSGGVVVLDSSLSIEGPVDPSLAGRYHCQASYHKHMASLQFEIKVNPRLPVSVPPNISVSVKESRDTLHIECVASDANPAANVSWVPMQGLNATVESDITSSNGLHSVRSVLTVPACLPQALTVECVVEHPTLASTKAHGVVLPSCGRASVSLRSDIVWETELAYVAAECRVDGAGPDAALTWSTACKHGVSALRAHSLQQGNGTEVWSTVLLSVISYAGCTVICELDQDRLTAQARKTIDIPFIGPSEIGVSVGPQRDSMLWTAVCKYRGDAVTPNMSWFITDHNTTTIPTRIHSEYEGVTGLLIYTYEFQLSQHEGSNLTCVIQNSYGGDMEKTVHVPKYFISSIMVLNTTIVMRGNRRQEDILRVILQRGLVRQRIVFRVDGNTPEYQFTCFRADGSAASTVATTLLFAESVSERDAGLYRCHASWNHHKASICVQVDVSSPNILTLEFIVIIFSTATAISLILFVPLFVFCKRCGRSSSSIKDRKNRESLAGLMQDLRSPELKKAALGERKAQEYAELVRYSIVIDVKSTV